MPNKGFSPVLFLLLAMAPAFAGDPQGPREALRDLVRIYRRGTVEEYANRLSKGYREYLEIYTGLSDQLLAARASWVRAKDPEIESVRMDKVGARVTIKGQAAEMVFVLEEGAWKFDDPGLRAPPLTLAGYYENRSPFFRVQLPDAWGPAPSAEDRVFASATGETLTVHFENVAALDLGVIIDEVKKDAHERGIPLTEAREEKFGDRRAFLAVLAERVGTTDVKKLRVLVQVSGGYFSLLYGAGAKSFDRLKKTLEASARSFTVTPRAPK